MIKTLFIAFLIFLAGCMFLGGQWASGLVTLGNLSWLAGGDGDEDGDEE